MYLWRITKLKKWLLNVSFVFLIGVLSAGLAGCEGGGGGAKNTTTNDIAPSITSHPQDTAVSTGQTASFSATATAPLSR